MYMQCITDHCATEMKVDCIVRQQPDTIALAASSLRRRSVRKLALAICVCERCTKS
jgi:hypothetical protein